MSRPVLRCAALLCLTAAVAVAQPADPARKSVAKVAAFTAEQAGRGKAAYDANCTSCHLPGLDGAANPAASAKGAPLVGPRFVQDFGETRVSALFNKMKRDMPGGKPGSLSDQEYLDIAAYVLQQNKFPAGSEALTVESATDIWIPGAGGAEGLVDNTYVAGIGCLSQDPTRSWMLVKAQGLRKTDAAAAPVAFTEAPGEYSFRLLNAYNYAPEPQNGRRVRIAGYLVRLGAEIRVFVQQLQPAGASCGLDGVSAPAISVTAAVAPPAQQTVVAPAEPAGRPSGQTVWSGVFSEAQAYRGEKVADTLCQGCHGAGLAGGDSGPRLVGEKFLSAWNARSAGDLFAVISRTMPENAPGTLKPEDVASVVAYILKVNNLPDGRQDLPAEQGALSAIAILAARP